MESKEVEVTFHPDEEGEEEEETSLRRRLIKPSEDDLGEILEEELKECKYGKKVYLARRKISDPWWCVGLQVFVIALAVIFTYHAYYYFDHLHFHVTKGYAHLGYDVAQHKTGLHLLKGKGVEKNEEEAYRWMKAASDQGHPEAGYHLAIAHLKGKDVGLNQGDAHPLLMHAAEHGLRPAQKMIKEVCVNGGCEV